MSYPEPRYLGERGLVNASYRPAETPADVTYASGGEAHFVATGALTEGRFGLYRWEMTAAGGGPAPHFHRTLSESFYVLSGVIRLYDGQRWIDGRPGDFVYVPEGGIHAFRNESGAPASMLILFAPGAPREDYFRGTAQLSRGVELTDEEREAFFVAHDNIFV